METKISHDRLQELLGEIDKWNLYDEVITEFNNYNSSVDVSLYYCVGGECKCRGDGTKLLRTLIVDRETNDIYRQSFNIEWCPEEQKKWLWSVTTLQQVESIQRAKVLQKGRTSLAWFKFCKTFE